VAELLAHVDYIDEAIARLSQEVESRIAPFSKEVELLVTIPGISRRTAEVLLAEIGADMSVFPTADHLASWAGLCPGNNESAGKHHSGKTRKGSKWLRKALVESASSAARTKDTYLAAQFGRLKGRCGYKKAVVAVAHSLLVIVYHVLSRQEPYHDLGYDYFQRRDSEAHKNRLVHQLEQLGYQVTVASAA